MTAEIKDIGISVNPPKAECNDINCPFHGNLSVRGQVIEGKVTTVRMSKTVVVEHSYLKYQKKYERYEKRTNRYSVHAPACFDLKAGDRVKIMECRPLSKTVSFVVVEKRD